MNLEVVGFPGACGFKQFKNQGVLNDVRAGDVGNYLLTYKINTLPGCSGGAVYVTDKDWIKKHTGSNKRKMLVGIHVGSITAEKLNVATLITPTIKHWLDQTAAEIT